MRNLDLFMILCAKTGSQKFRMRSLFRIGNPGFSLGNCWTNEMHRLYLMPVRYLCFCQLASFGAKLILKNK